MKIGLGLKAVIFVSFFTSSAFAGDKACAQLFGTTSSESLAIPFRRILLENGENLYNRSGVTKDSQENTIDQNEKEIFKAHIDISDYKNLTTVRLTKTTHKTVKEADRIALALLNNGGVEEVSVPGRFIKETKEETKIFIITDATSVRATPVLGLFAIGKQDGTIELIHFDQSKAFNGETSYSRDLPLVEPQQTQLEARIGAASGLNPRFNGSYKNGNSIKDIRVKEMAKDSNSYESTLTKFLGVAFNVQVTRENGTVEDIDVNSVNEIARKLFSVRDSFDPRTGKFIRHLN